MRARRSALVLLDLLAMAAIGLLVLGLLLPANARVRELSKQSVCAINLAGIGASAKIYANDNNERWMIPPHSDGAYDPSGNGIDYLNDDGTIGTGSSNTDPGEVGYDRVRESTRGESGGINLGSQAVSVTRAYWMMVRSGDVTVHQFVCPSSAETADPTQVIDRYYDFDSYRNISYGYRVPFGPRDSQPREGADHRVIFAADKSPYYQAGSDPTDAMRSGGTDGEPIDLDDPPALWRRFNSPNHGGAGNGEGQNCVYADGRVSFQRIPAVGADDDNIYTVMLDEWDTPQRFNMIHGDSPHISAVRNPYPGVESLGYGPEDYASTDSLIYP